MLDEVDDLYDYGEENDEKSKITEESSSFDGTSQNSEILPIDEILFEYNKDDFFSAEEILEIENETGMKFV